MRRKLLRVSAEFLVGLLRRDDRTEPLGHVMVIEGMPDDARITFSFFDGERGDVILMVESGTFDEVKPGEAHPYFDIQWWQSKPYVPSPGSFLMASQLDPAAPPVDWNAATAEQAASVLSADAVAELYGTPPADPPAPIKFREFL